MSRAFIRSKFAVSCACLCAMFFAVSSSAVSEPLCGDINGDGTATDLSDIIHLVNFLFLGGSGPNCPYTADCNADGLLDMSDLIRLVNLAFLGGPAPDCPAIIHESTDGQCLQTDKFPGIAGSMSMLSVTQGECIAFPELGEEDSTEYMYAEIVGDDLHVHHFNAYYNCCMMYAVTAQIENTPGGYYVTVQEADTTNNPCYCMCYFNLEAVIYLIEIQEPTMYIVELIHGDGYTVGIDTVWIGQEESMHVDVVGDDLYIHHMGAWMNCCPGFFTTFEFDENVIRAFEGDSLGMCDCYCLYNLRSILYDVYPGTWIVELYGIWPVGQLVGIDTVIVAPGR